MIPTLIVSLCLAGSPLAPSMARQDVEIRPAGKDLLHIRAVHPIADTYLTNPRVRYSYFVEYSGDRREALILLRTSNDPLEVMVETGVPGLGMTQKHKKEVRNPLAPW